MEDQVREQIEQYVEEHPCVTYIDWDLERSVVDEYAGEDNIEMALVDKVWTHNEVWLWENKKAYINYLVKRFHEETDLSPEELEDAICEEMEIFTDIDVSPMLKNNYVRGLVEVYSNYDCMNSHHLETSGIGYTYGDSYFGDMVDALRLNPRRLQIIMQWVGVAVEEDDVWPDRPEREPLVSYRAFLEEVTNNCGYAVLWTFPIKVSLQQMAQNPDPDAISIPKGAICGLYDKANGGGSLMEAKLARDVELELGSYHPGRPAEDYDEIGLNMPISGYSPYEVYQARLHTEAELVTKEEKGEEL